MTLFKKSYMPHAIKHDDPQPLDPFGNYLAAKAYFSCGHFKIPLPKNAGDISLTMSQNERMYDFPQTACYGCGGFKHEARLPNKDTVGDYLSTDAVFACKHLHWKLPEEAQDIRLRKRNGLRTYFFPINCYNCEFKREIATDEELDARHHYTERLDTLSRRIEVINVYIRREYTKGTPKSDIKADPAYAKRTALLEDYNSLGEERALKWKKYWKPFQERWGDHENREFLLKPRSKWFDGVDAR